MNSALHEIINRIKPIIGLHDRECYESISMPGMLSLTIKSEGTVVPGFALTLIEDSIGKVSYMLQSNSDLAMSIVAELKGLNRLLLDVEPLWLKTANDMVSEAFGIMDLSAKFSFTSEAMIICSQEKPMSLVTIRSSQMSYYGLETDLVARLEDIAADLDISFERQTRRLADG